MTTLLKGLSPPGLGKKNAGAIYRAIDTAIASFEEDGLEAASDFFPFLARPAALERHIDSLGIPRFDFDTEAERRERAAAAGFYLDRQGERGTVKEALDAIVPSRYQLIEYPFAGFRIGFSQLGSAAIGGGTRLFVKVRGLTPAEQAKIEAFLDASLDPDIEINVVAWELHTASPASIELIRKYGGSRWIASRLADVGTASVELLPDDGFLVGESRLGTSRISGQRSPLIIIRCSSTIAQAVVERLSLIVDSSIERRVLGE